MTRISDVFEQLAEGCDFYICLGNFLDEFYGSNQTARAEMIQAEPPSVRVPKEYKAFLAAAVHKLANDYGLDVPAWTFKKDYYLLEKPFFDCQAKGKLRLLFMYKSPLEFKHRNVFVDENVLVRV